MEHPAFQRRPLRFWTESAKLKIPYAGKRPSKERRCQKPHRSNGLSSAAPAVWLLVWSINIAVPFDDNALYAS